MGIHDCVHTRMSKCLWNQVQKNCLHFLEDQLIFRDHIHTEGIDISYFEPSPCIPGLTCLSVLILPTLHLYKSNAVRNCGFLLLISMIRKYIKICLIVSKHIDICNKVM